MGPKAPIIATGGLALLWLPSLWPESGFLLQYLGHSDGPGLKSCWSQPVGLDRARVPAGAAELSGSRCPGCCQRQRNGPGASRWRWSRGGGEARGAGSLQQQAPGVGATGPKAMVVEASVQKKVCSGGSRNAV